MTTSRSFRVTSLTSTGCSPMSDQGRNINDYGSYLTMRVKAFANVKLDYVKAKADPEGQGRLRKLTVEKGLLRETEMVQNLIGPLIKCKFVEGASDNEVTLTAFRLLVADLLVLFQVANEGVINVLEHYFEMTKVDADRALKIYQRFVEQTDGVIVYMSLARSLESVTRLTIPNLQHAPTSLGNSLEEYLNDPDFEQNRIQYLAQKGLKGKPASAPAIDTTAARSNGPLKSVLKASANPYGASQIPQQAAVSGNNDLIDFFDSIEPQRQQPQMNYAMTQPQVNPYVQQMPQQIQPQMTNPYMQQIQPQMTQQTMPQQYTGYQPAPSQVPLSTGYNPYTQQMQAQNTGAGFGGYTPQYTTTIQPQTTGQNPFRKSMLPQGMMQPDLVSPQRTGNPFQRTAAPMPQQYTNQIQQQTTGNPFAKPQYQQQPIIQSQTTGNPFRKSMPYQ